MEADWSVELAADCPRIVVPWMEADGCILRYIDLSSGLDRIEQVEETRDSPALRAALLSLNAPASPFMTVKCDRWETCAEEIDPVEFDASTAETACTAGSYIDLLRREPARFVSFEFHEPWLREVTAQVRERSLRGARMDFILRHAKLHGQPGFAVSWFVQGCGATPEQAHLRWSEALALGLAAVAPTSSAADATMTFRDTGASSSIG